MCSAFIPDCAYDKSTIILLGDLYFPNTNYLVKLCLHKKTFESLGRSDFQCPHFAYVCQVRNILFEDQKHSFFSCHLVKGVYLFEGSPKSIQDVTGDVYCPGGYCLNREKCESIEG